MRLLYFLGAFSFAFSVAHAQCAGTGAAEVIIPQIVDGGGWVTTIALTNLNPTSATTGLALFQETGGGATQPWNLNFQEMTSAQVLALTLSGGSTVFLHSPGTAPKATVGWGYFTVGGCGGGGVLGGYAIFTERVAGRPDQEGTAEAALAASRILVPFDDTNGAVTSMAIANTGSPAIISVGLRTSDGTVSQLPAITLPNGGHLSFAFPAQFPVSAGQAGLAEFYSASGSFSIIALRFSPGGAFTATPVYSATGPPIIASAQ